MAELSKIFPEQFTVKAQEPLFPMWLSVVKWLSVCVQMAAAMEAAILPVWPDAKLRRQFVKLFLLMMNEICYRLSSLVRSLVVKVGVMIS